MTSEGVMVGLAQLALLFGVAAFRRWWQGKVVVVTGATSGNGEATAHLLAALGACVVGVGRNTSKLTLLAQAGIDAQRCDLSSSEEIARLAAHMQATYGKLDGIIHLAGTALLGRSPSTEQIRAFRRNDLEGPQELIGVLLPLLRQSGFIAINTSAASSFEVKEAPHYSAVKAEVRGWTEQLRSDLSPRGVQVVLIFMGAVATQIWSTTPGLPGWTRKFMMIASSSPEACAPVIIRDIMQGRHISLPGRGASIAWYVPGTGTILSRISSLIHVSTD